MARTVKPNPPREAPRRGFNLKRPSQASTDAPPVDAASTSPCLALLRSFLLPSLLGRLLGGLALLRHLNHLLSAFQNTLPVRLVKRNFSSSSDRCLLISAADPPTHEPIRAPRLRRSTRADRPGALCRGDARCECHGGDACAACGADASRRTRACLRMSRKQLVFRRFRTHSPRAASHPFRGST